jgi:hypothetical protein
MSADKPDQQQAASIIEKLLLKEQERRHQEEHVIEDRKQWELVINRLASTADGKYFFTRMVRHSAIFAVDEDYNPVNLAVAKAKSSFYRKYVRPYLEKQLKNKIEV